jgi:D-alanyl-D-alanine carboxypeptidase
VDGVDGIKTGYIGASGFNLVTSVHRGNRYLVAVVMGGSSAGSRDAKMRDLISDKIAQASTTRTAPMVAEAGGTADVRVAKIEPKPESKSESKPERKVAVAIIEPKNESKAEAKGETKPERRFAVASAASIPVRLNAPAAQSETAAQTRVAAGSTDPIRPVLVKTVTVRATPHTAAPAPLNAELPSAPTPQVAPAAAKPEPKAEPKAAEPTAAEPNAAEPKTAEPKTAEPKTAEPKVEPKPEPKSEQRFALASATSVPARFTPPSTQAEPARSVVTAAEPPSTATVAAPPVAPARTRTVAVEPPPAPAPAAPPPSAAPAKQHVRSGWMIQVGAYPAEQDAKQRLSAVQSKASKVLTGADPFTETVDKGGTTLYRARFAGLDKDQAEAACKYLKRDGVDCVPIKN